MRVSLALLSYDHGIIRTVIDVLGEVAKKGAVGKPRSEMSEMIVFLDRFIDKYHHQKEELFIFPSAINSDSSLMSEIDRLVDDHHHAGKLLSDLVSSVSPGGEVDNAETKGLMGQIVELMTAHIDKEELHIFPEIETKLSINEDMQVYKRCKEFTDKNFGQDYLRSSDRFAKRIQEHFMSPTYPKIPAHNGSFSQPVTKNM